MKLKFIFLLIEYLGKSTEFFWDFSKFLYFPPLVDTYRHPLLSDHLRITRKYKGFPIERKRKREDFFRLAS